MRALFLIENVPFSLDSRVQRQTNALRARGVELAVICPRAAGEIFHERVDGVEIYRYPKPAVGGGFLSHLLEYLTSLLAHTVLTLVVFVRHRFDVIHVANPPDILWLVALPYRLFGKRFIYDQHDLVPELFEVRFANRLPLLKRVVLFLERASYRLADHVIVTNETFKKLAMARGGRAIEDVTVVRNGPFLDRDFPRDVIPDASIRAQAAIVIGYLGIMNPQDQLENFLSLAKKIRLDQGRRDVAFVMVGSGDAFSSLQALRDQMGLRDAVTMLGTVPWRRVLEVLSATDICIQPDLPTAFNQHLTMNKLMEYMALGKAVVAFDMPETRISGGDAVAYVSEYTVEALADTTLALIDNPRHRAELGLRARRRVETELAWEHQERHLVQVYERLFPQLRANSVAQPG